MTQLHVIYRTNIAEVLTGPRGYRPHDGKKFYNNPIYERTPWYDKHIYFLSILSDLDKDTRLTIVYDGQPNTPWFDFLNNWVQQHNVKYPGQAEIVQGILGSDRASLHRCFDVASQSQSPWLFFVEDDYLHKPGWLNIVKQIMTSTELPVGIFSLYDHLDRYTRTDDVTKGLEYLRLTSYLKDAIHMRTAEATTNTYFLSKELFLKLEQELRNYAPSDRPLFRKLIHDGIRLWQPIPGWSTHDHIEFLSPGVDWERIAADVRAKYGL